VLTHVGVLGWAVLGRADEVPGHLAAVPSSVAAMTTQLGIAGTFGVFLLSFASGGSVYTGVEAVSNAAPLLREPKVRTARRTMVLVAGVPAVLFTLIVLGYVLYGVRPEGDKSLNAVLFEHVAARWAPDRGGLAALVTVPPLLAEALLLLVAAQTGFSDGPRTLAALASDRFLPRSLVRLNTRLAPERGILVIGGIAFVTTLLARAQLAPLIAIFVTCVFVTVTISQAAMLLEALRTPPEARPLRAIALHGTALALSLVILIGTVVDLGVGAVVALAAIAVGSALCWTSRERTGRAEITLHQRLEGAPELASSPSPPGTAAEASAPPRWFVVLVGDRPQLAPLALAWIQRHAGRTAGVTFAQVAVVDAETIHGQEHIEAVERASRERLEALVELARASGLEADMAVHRAVDLVSASAGIAADLVRERPGPALVVVSRPSPVRRRWRPWRRADTAGHIAARVAREGLAVVVLDLAPAPGS
jgi:hypothetical protein